MKVQKPLRLLLLCLAGAILITIASVSASRHVAALAVTSEKLPVAVLQAPLHDLHGNTFHLADFKGDVVVVDLWASWCPSCRVAVPDLVKISNDYANRHVQVVGLTFENPARAGIAVSQAVSDLGMNYQVGWIDPAIVASFAIFRDGGAPIPQTFILTRDGHVQAKGISLDGEEIRQAVDAALKSKP